MAKLKKDSTIKVKMITSMAGMDFSHEHGKIVEVSPEIAEAWIAAEIAIPVGDE